MHATGELLAWMALLHLEFGLAVSATETKHFKQALNHLAECNRPLEEVRLRLDRTLLWMPEMQEAMRSESRVLSIDIQMQLCVAEAHQAHAHAQAVYHGLLLSWLEVFLIDGYL
jgi:hypothetical protein